MFNAKPLSEYNFSSNEEVSIIDLVKIICNYCKVDIKKAIKFGPERKGKDLIYRLDCKKANSELDWESKTSLDAGISQVHKWISENNDYLSNSSWNYIHKC